MFGNKAKKIEIQVEGMSCSHCEQTVRTTLAEIPGVAKVIDVDKDKNLATVKVDDPENAPVDAMVAAVTEAGYPSSAVAK